ncbi:hypothetical protein GCM10010124_04770 [Pilimelia terevasa]|uniref:Peptidoglycan recognition protein family domain-containing protein n=1 Tax=Pilimelia terevasa TaxID=53372 RepID=A0A8J3BMW0_9ACTN|nr:N-acetylmuramoyl-L-alanine amidase [Pilimelia terevasa]GGK15227.1 hypothetical protein GCM10010124_04770 [Pilimelia terevasa]
MPTALLGAVAVLAAAAPGAPSPLPYRLRLAPPTAPADGATAGAATSGDATAAATADAATTDAVTADGVTAPDRAARTTRIALGDPDRPAAGVRRSRDLPAGAGLSREATADQPAGAVRRTLVLRRVRTPEFSALGLTWRAARPAAVSVAVRVRQQGRWTAWSTVDPGEPGRRPVAGRPLPEASEMQWYGPSTGVELAVTAVGAVTPRDLAVDLIDPGRQAAADDAAARPAAALPTNGRATHGQTATDPAATGAVGGAAAATPGVGSGRVASDAGELALARGAVAPYLSPRVPMPRIHRRASWGADPRRMTWPPELQLPQVKAAALHHTATTNRYSRGQVPAILRAIYHFHAVSRGWGDIGYNVLVDRYGRLWEGRAGGLASSVIGGHTGGFNSYVAGVSMIGDFGAVGVSRTMIESISRYLAWKFTLGPNFDPRGRVRLVGGGYSARWRPGTAVTVPRIFPHRQTNHTSCPGARGVAALPAIRTRTASIMGGWVAPARPRVRYSVFRPSTGAWSVRGITGALVTGAVGYTPVPADYDGDGTTDLAVYHPANRTWLIWQSHTRTLRRVLLGGVGQLPAPADVNGDGVAEPMTFAPSTGLWRRPGAAPVRWGGAPGDRPVPADYTGDGRDDLAVFRSASRTWYVARRAGVGFGSVGDRAVPADYDSNGRVDFGVWTASTDLVKMRLSPTRVVSVPAGDTPLWGQYNGDLIADPLTWGVHGSVARFLYQGRYQYRWGTTGDIPLPLT